jgi:hypothetical protein
MTATLAAVNNASWPGGYLTIGLVVLLAAFLYITRPEAPSAIETGAPGELGGPPCRPTRARHRASARVACLRRLRAIARARESVSR